MSAVTQWYLDSSTFINAAAIERINVLVSIRAPISFPEYVYRVELGSNARPGTRTLAEAAVQSGRVTLRQMSLEDLDRISALGAPRRIGLGELTCAVLAERDGGAVLCDDWKARGWLLEKITTLVWHSIEDCLLDAASKFLLDEYDLERDEETLRENRYVCRIKLKEEHLLRRLNIR